MGNIAAVAVFCLVYGVAFVLFDPTVRVALEAVAFVCIAFMGPFFLAFGLDYTGRSDLIHNPLFVLVFAVPLLTAVLAATNAVHGLVWTNPQFEPVFGLATLTYTIQPWGIFALLFSIGTAAVGSLLLIGAILSYGSLYRREATAVILSTAPPTVGVSLWLFGVGPVPELHLTAPLMLLHVALDAYAFVGTHMFETNPATQRTAERTGLDSLSDPVFILDPDDRIVRMNDSAADLFLPSLGGTLPMPLEAAIGMSLATLRQRGELTVGSRDTGVFALSYTPLTDPTGEMVGSMIVLYDVSAERQREQQLAVLNRVLRHNLRNETTVISGYAEILEAELTDPEMATYAGRIATASDRLNAIGDKVRSFEQIQKRPIEPETISVADIVTDVDERWSAAVDEASITCTIEPTSLSLRTDSVLLSMLLNNLVENAIIHSGATDEWVDLTVTEAPATDTAVRFEIRDTNDPIPDHEIETLRAGEETPLQHGQGIRLWIVYWCVRKLHGDIDFAYDEGNVLTVTLPSIADDAIDPTEVTAVGSMKAEESETTEKSTKAEESANET